MIPKIRTPYAVKLVKIKTPIFEHARFGPTEKDIDNAIEEGYYYGAGHLTNKIGKIYNENKDRPEPLTAEELVNKIFNMNNLKEKGPTVESVPPTAKTSRESSPIKKPETLFKPEIKKELDEKLSKLKKTRESADKKAVKEGKKYIERKTTKEKAKERMEKEEEDEEAIEQRLRDEDEVLFSFPFKKKKKELYGKEEYEGLLKDKPVVENKEAIDYLKMVLPKGQVNNKDLKELNNYNEEDINYADTELRKQLGNYYLGKSQNAQKRIQLMYLKNNILNLEPDKIFLQKPKDSPRKGKKH